jgi:polyphosphate kinase
MPRNLDHRIEIVVPVEDAEAKAELEGVFDVLLADDTAWILGADGSWRRSERPEGQSTRQTHETLMRRAARLRLVGTSKRGAVRLRGFSTERTCA